MGNFGAGKKENSIMCTLISNITVPNLEYVLAFGRREIITTQKCLHESLPLDFNFCRNWKLKISFSTVSVSIVWFDETFLVAKCVLPVV